MNAARRRRGGTVAGKLIRAGVRNKTRHEIKASGGSLKKFRRELKKENDYRLYSSNTSGDVDDSRIEQKVRGRRYDAPKAKHCGHVLQWRQRKRVALGGTAKQDAAFRRTGGREGKRELVLAERHETCGHTPKNHVDGQCKQCAPWNKHHRFKVDATPTARTKAAIALTDSLRDAITDKIRALVS